MNDAPSVLAILVVKDGARWMKAALASLARQTHPRLGVLGVDNASRDGSRELLERLLGSRRVLRLDRNVGFPGAVARALATPVAEQADYVLLLHDDTVLMGDAVANLVRAARSTDGVGVVGPKVLDTEQKRVVREIGHTTDRFGYRYSPLEEGEIDLGQHDSPREVLFVSSAAMLVAREAWKRAGPPDERLRPCHGDLDFCWRIRIAGFRVVMDPRAVVRHASAGDRGKRPGVRTERGRYLDERSSLTGMLKNYRLFTLLWVMPLFLLQGVGKIALFLLSRRFRSARQVLTAWGWALLRIPGTLRRRVRVQATRVNPDREVTPYMAPASTRIRRWFGQASAALLPGRGSALDLDEDVEVVPLGERVRGTITRYPAVLAIGLGILLSLVAFRHVLLASPLEGGALPVFPESANDLLARWVDGWVPGGFTGPGIASPALVPLALGSFITLGNPRILAWIIVAVAPLAAGSIAYRAVLPRIGHRGPSVAAGAAYALSSVALWVVSEGRIASIVFIVALPWLAARLALPFDEPIERPLAWAAGTAIGVGIVGSFLPSSWSALALLTLLAALFTPRGGSRIRGLVLAVGGAAGAALLAYPFALDLIELGTGRGADLVMLPSFSQVLRLSPGPAPGSWTPALFLPVAGAVGFAVAGGAQRHAAWRAAFAAATAMPLGWLAASGYLPGSADEPVVYLGLAAYSLSVLVGLGFRSVVAGVERHAFGARQLAFGLLVVLVGGGVLLQSAHAVLGGWAVREGRIPPAYPVVQTAERDVPARVLWLGRVGGGPFPAPGGSPQGVVEARSASVRYGVTGRAGRSILAVGLPAAGPSYEHLERALRSMLVGRVRHGGSLLSPFGVSFVVAGEGDLPEAAVERLDSQLDLLPAQRAGGLLIYRNARSLPIGGVLPEGTVSEARATDILAPARVDRAGLIPLRRVGAGAWEGRALPESPGVLVLSTEFDPNWQLVESAAQEPFVAFGWGVGFEVPGGTGSVRLELPGGWRRTLEVGVLGVLWAGALWLASRRGRA